MYNKYICELSQSVFLKFGDLLKEDTDMLIQLDFYVLADQ